MNKRVPSKLNLRFSLANRKRAVSTIVASVFVIMLSVFAVAILFTFVMPTVNDNLQEAAREPVELSIQTSGGYTIWDETNKLAKVQIRRGNDNNDLEGVRFQFIKETDTLEHTSTEVPVAGQVKTYSFILGDFGKPEGIKITAIVDGKEVEVRGASEVGEAFSSSEESLANGNSGDDKTTAPYIGDNCFDALLGTICTCEDLQNMETNLSGNYVLQNNVDCSDTVNWNGGAGFDPIGTGGDSFTGSLEGQGHTIDNLLIYRPSETVIGLFGYTNGAHMASVGLTGISIQGSGAIGAFAGTFYNSSIINSYVKGDLVGSTNNVGMFTGNLVYGSNITSSYALGTVQGALAVGGLTGLDSLGGNIESTFNIVNITKTGVTDNAGGVLGVNSAVTLVSTYWYNTTSDDAVHCYPSGDVGCTAINETTGISYFYTQQGATTTWDTNIWQFSGTDYPTLKFQN